MKRILLIFITVLFLTGCKENMPSEYYYNTLELNEIWEKSDGSTQTIAFIDTGISKEAEKLYSERIVDTYNSITGQKSVIDQHGHGTQMISVTSGNGEEGVLGIAPQSKILVVKAFKEGEQMDPIYIKKAIDYAISKKVNIINMSFGSFNSNKGIEDSIDNALKHNITVVAATGDYGNQDALFPSNLDGVVSVRAKDVQGETWEFSNTALTDVLATPGVEINSLTLNNETIKLNGTSHSTAIASGYIALLRDYYTKNSIPYDNSKIINELKSLDSLNNKNVSYSSLFQ